MKFAFDFGRPARLIGMGQPGVCMVHANSWHTAPTPSQYPWTTSHHRLITWTIRQDQATEHTGSTTQYPWSTSHLHEPKFWTNRQDQAREHALRKQGDIIWKHEFPLATSEVDTHSYKNKTAEELLHHTTTRPSPSPGRARKGDSHGLCGGPHTSRRGERESGRTQHDRFRKERVFWGAGVKRTTKEIRRRAGRDQVHWTSRSKYTLL